MSARIGWRIPARGKALLRYRRGAWYFHYRSRLCGVLLGPYASAREASWAPDDLEDAV